MALLTTGPDVLTGPLLLTGEQPEAGEDVDFLGFTERQRVVTYTGGPMILHRHTPAEYYDPGPVTEPALTDWAASFDDGANWVPGTPHPEDASRPVWLLAGPDAPNPPGGALVLADSVNPQLRGSGGQETIVRPAPRITVPRDFTPATG